MTVNPINFFFGSLCSLSIDENIDLTLIERINELNDDACRRGIHSFLNKQKKNVINEDIITKQLQYKMSRSAELAD